MKTYDLVVVGGGTAGSQAAKIARDSGASVVMFNDGELGGLCILRGCMPTKTMLHAAQLAHEAEHPATDGVRSTGLDLDFRAVMANKDVKVERFKQAKIASIKAGGYDVIDARARFIGPDLVEAAGETYRFTAGAVIATGSVPWVPPIPGLEDVPFLTSDEVMRLTERPASLAVVGSGATGSELAQFFARVGTEVHLLTRSPVGSKIDIDIAGELERMFKAEPRLELYNGVLPTRFEAVGGGMRAELADGRVLEVEALLMATGRAPDVAGLGLEEAGVELRNGRLAAGPDLRTTNPKIFAAGDATGSELLLHVANWEGAVAARNALDPAAGHEIEQRLAMEVIFLDPPLAWLGLSESSARDRGHEVVTSLVRFPETGRAITMDAYHGVSKLVADARSGEILGAQVLGPRADDIIHIVSSIAYYRGKAADMLEMPWYHPTLSEVLVSQARELAEKTSAQAVIPAA